MRIIKEKVLVSKDLTIGSVQIKAAYQRLTEDDGIKIVEVGLLVRKYILLESQMPFERTFSTNCLS